MERVASLGMSLGKIMGEEVGSRRGTTDEFLGRNGDGKSEDSCLGETMGEGSSDVC